MSKIETVRQLARQASEQEPAMTAPKAEWQMPKEDWEVLLETLPYMVQNSSNQLDLMLRMETEQRKQAAQLTAMTEELATQRKYQQQMFRWIKVLVMMIGGIMLAAMYLALR